MSYVNDIATPSRQVHCLSTSGQALTSTLGSDLYFKFNEPVAIADQNVDIVVSVVSASIPYSWVNISGTSPLYNNQLIFSTSAGTFNITVPDGYYNIQELLNYVNPLLAPIVMSYNRPTATVSLTINNGDSFAILAGSSLLTYLGFGSSFPLFSGTTLTGTQPINLMRTQSIYVLSDLTTESFDSRTNNRSQILCRIPVKGVPGGFITYDNITNFKTRLHSKQIGSQLHIKLQDDTGNDIDLRGYPWSITVQFDFVSSLPSPQQQVGSLNQQIYTTPTWKNRSTLG